MGNASDQEPLPISQYGSTTMSNYIGDATETASSSGGGMALFVVVVIILVAMAGGGSKALVHNASSASSSSASTGSIRQQIQSVFGVYGNEAVTVAECESSMNPGAYNSQPVPDGEHAQGLFQIIPSTFRSAGAGGDVYNATDNINAAYAIFKRDGNSWQEWVCKPY